MVNVLIKLIILLSHKVQQILLNIIPFKANVDIAFKAMELDVKIPYVHYQ